MIGIRLRRNTEPVWVALGNGAEALASPPTTALVYAARAQADALFAALQESGQAVTMAGGHVTGLPDIATPEGEAGVRHTLYVLSLAELAILDWEGVGDEEGAPLAFDGGLVVHLMSDATAADNFIHGYLHPLNQVAAEGNA